MNFLDVLSPLLSRLRPRLGLSNELRATAARSWQIAPSVSTFAPKALFDESDLAKVTGGSPDRSKEAEMAPVWGGERKHAATTAFELHHAVVANGNAFTRRTALQISGARRPLFASMSRVEHTEGVVASSTYGLRYFGHWLLDDIPRLLAARELGTAITMLTSPTAGQRSYVDLLGLGSDVVTEGFFRRLIVLDDSGQNAFKKERNLALRATARKLARPRGAPGVMLLRGATQRRRLLNEPEVADIARSRGFLVLDPAATSAQDIVDACMDVDIVLGVEGSQLANGLAWMSQSGTLLVLQPPQRFVSVLKDHCDNLGMRYAFIVCDAHPEEAFKVDTTALERMLDRIAS